MKKIMIILISLLWISGKGYSQSCDKFIEWDLDDLSIKKELPYNQSICFRLKSKKIDLTKISVVFLLEHKGKKNATASLDHYTKSDNLLQRKFYELRIKPDSYDKENKTLDVVLDEDDNASMLLDENDTSSKAPKGKPSYVLQPSRKYSIFLITSDPSSDINKLLNAIKTYSDSSGVSSQKADSIRRAKIHAKFKEMFKNMPLHSGFFEDTSETLLVNEYQHSLYKIDLETDSIKREIKAFINSSHVPEEKLSDSITTFIERNLSVIISKGGCISQLPCEIDKCTLYKFMIVLKERQADTTIRRLISGVVKLSDLINPLYKPNPNLTLAGSITNIDSSIFQLTNLKLYLNSLFINDCKFYSCCDSNKKIYNETGINSGLTGYMSCINEILKKLNFAKKMMQDQDESNAKRFSKIKNLALSYTITKMVSGNTLIYGLEPRAKLSIIPVFGYAYYGFQKSFNSFTPYTGIVISLAPLNDTIEFKFLKHKTLAQRLTFLTGVTLSSLKEDNKRDNLFSNGSNLLVGFGVKLNHIVTFNLGGIIFRKEDPNPFIATKKVAVTPFAALSINLKLKTLFEGLMGLIPGK